ncbi:MAG TPA: preprotein translocase subunit SecE [Candidatus Dormibacteraeota bacterium]|nr:preprotein translocase subunit SecE [Candidatus Dormibacteraeota bacterium]
MAVTTRRRDEPRAQPSGGAAQFLRDVYDELRKVVWPTGGELYRYTLVVIFTVVFLGVFIGGVDYLVSKGFQATIYNNGVH